MNSAKEKRILIEDIEVYMEDVMDLLVLIQNKHESLKEMVKEEEARAEEQNS